MRQNWNAVRALSLLVFLPSALSFLLAFVGNWVFGGLDAAVRVFRDYLAPTTLIPLVTLLASLVVVIPLTRWGALSARRHWEVGGCVALASLVGVGILGAAFGGAYLFYVSLAWAVATGYVGFVWIGGAYLWKSLTPLRSDAAPTRVNEPPA